MAIDLEKYKLKGNLDKYKLKQMAPQAVKPTSFADKLVQTRTTETGLKGVATGFTKGVLSTVTGLGQLVSKGLSKLPGQAGEFFKGGAEYGQELQDGLLKAQTPSEKVGKGIEQVAEFFIPATKAAKAQKALDLVIDGSKLIKPAKVIAKTVGAFGTEALGAGAIGLAQTGGDFESAGKTALTAGVLGGTLKGTGEILKSVGIPEVLYSRIFKNELNTIKNEFKTGNLSKIAKTDPERYAQLVENGLIKNNKFSETLAKQALDRGLKGSLSNMANKVLEDSLSLELQALQKIKGKKISLTGGRVSNLTKTLNDVAKDYKNIGSGEIGDKAAEFASLLSKGKGKISGERLLELRRFMDGMRIKSSYTPSAKLSLGQENMKYWSDFLRGKLNDIDGVGDIMKDYSFNIKAFDAIAKRASAGKNNNILGLFDSVLLGAGKVLPAIGIKAGRTATGLTNTAQLIERGINTTAKSGLVGGVSGILNQ